MCDLIDRQAAIDALKKDMASLDHIIKGMSANDVRLDAYVSQRNQVNYDIYTINNLPTEQPEQLGTNLAEVGTDLVSRQAVIDLLKQLRKDGDMVPWEGKDVFARIRELPEEPHWIPVTEDTPIEDGDYWCTFGAETGWFVDWCSWYHGRWVVWLNDIPNDVSNVIAWCKPFEPYKGVTNDRF